MNLIRDPARLIEVLKHPGVLPWVAPDGCLVEDFDFSSRMYLDLGRGYASFGKWAPDFWDVHVAMLPKSPPVAPLMRSALKGMEDVHGAMGFIANIPAINFPARRLARLCGFDECGRIPGAVVIGGGRVDITIYSRRKQWKQ